MMSEATAVTGQGHSAGSTAQRGQLPTASFPPGNACLAQPYIWRRVLAKGAGWLLVLLLTFGTYLLVRSWYIHWAGTRDLGLALAETEREFPHWTWESLRRDPDFAPTNDEGAKLLESLYHELAKRGGGDPWQALQELQAYRLLTGVRQELLSARGSAAKAMPRRALEECARFAQQILAFRHVPPGGRMDVCPLGAWETPQHLQALQLLVSLTSALAVWELDNGRPEHALEYAEAMLGMANAVRQEPTLLAFAHWAEMEQSAARLLELTLARTEISEQRLAYWQRRFEELLPLPRFERIVRGERARTELALARLGDAAQRRAIFDSLLQQCAPSRQRFLDDPFSWATQQTQEIWLAYQLGTWLPYLRTQSLRYFNEAEVLFRLSPEQFERQVPSFLYRWEGYRHDLWRDEWRVMSIFAGWLLDWPVRNLMRHRDERDACLAAAVLAIGLERYRMQHGHWPIRFSDLPADWLPKVPHLNLKQDAYLHPVEDAVVVQVRTKFGHSSPLSPQWREWRWFAYEPGTFILFDPPKRLYVRRPDA